MAIVPTVSPVQVNKRICIVRPRFAISTLLPTGLCSVECFLVVHTHHLYLWTLCPKKFFDVPCLNLFCRIEVITQFILYIAGHIILLSVQPQ